MLFDRSVWPDDDFAAIPFEVAVSDGHVFLMGDTRNNSADSRMFLGTPGDGTVPVAAVHGVVVSRFSIVSGATPLSTTAFDEFEPSTVDKLPGYAWWVTLVGLILSVLAFI